MDSLFAHADLNGWLGLIVLLVGGILAFSRLESKSRVNERDITRLYKWKEEQLENRLTSIEDKHQDLDNRVMEKLSNIEKMVAKIEGKLDIT